MRPFKEVSVNSKPEDVLSAYLAAFASLDPDAIVPFYQIPSIFLTRSGAKIISDAASARATVSTFVEQARNQGYRRTELAGGLTVRRLGAELASLAGVFRRLGSNDQEITRFGFTYIMRDSGEGWKIAVALAYDEPTAEA
jgi:hypothetical protein